MAHDEEATKFLKMLGFWHHGVRDGNFEQMLKDILTTFVEGGPYSWFGVIKTERDPNDACVTKVWVETGEDCDESRVETTTYEVDFELLETGIFKLFSEDEHTLYLSEDEILRLKQNFMVPAASDFDVNDVDVIMQVSTFGTVMYS